MLVFYEIIYFDKIHYYIRLILLVIFVNLLMESFFIFAFLLYNLIYNIFSTICYQLTYYWLFDLFVLIKLQLDSILERCTMDYLDPFIIVNLFLIGFYHYLFKEYLNFYFYNLYSVCHFLFLLAALLQLLNLILFIIVILSDLFEMPILEILLPSINMIDKVCLNVHAMITLNLIMYD